MPRPAKRIVEGLAVVTGTVVLRPGTRANKVVGRQIGMLGRHLRNRAGRLRGRRPDPDVPDDVLADRIRSSLGPVEKRLDLPHLNVMVEHHVALLHGVVGTAQEADELETAVAAVSGVVGVESYLHVGIGRGDTRPSAGRLVEPLGANRGASMTAATATTATTAITIQGMSAERRGGRRPCVDGPDFVGGSIGDVMSIVRGVQATRPRCSEPSTARRSTTVATLRRESSLPSASAIKRRISSQRAAPVISGTRSLGGHPKGLRSRVGAPGPLGPPLPSELPT